MASQLSGGLLLALALAIICTLMPRCSSSKEAMELFERACHCFDDPNIYGQCAAEWRLNAEGAFHVQRAQVDEYCGGPCLEETTLALQCVEEVAATGAEGFRFTNGASVLAVRKALGTGCGYGPERGTFEIRERKECAQEGEGGGGGEYYYHRPSDHADHEQQAVAGSRYYGEQPYGQGGYGEAGGGDEEHCSYGYGNAAAGSLLAEHRRGFMQVLILLVASAAMLRAL